MIQAFAAVLCSSVAAFWLGGWVERFRQRLDRFDQRVCESCGTHCRTDGGNICAHEANS